MTDPGSYYWHVGTLIDGQITNEIPVASSSWSTVMDDAGWLQVNVPLSDPAVAALDLYLIAEPCHCFLALSYVDSDGTETFLAAGPIWTHQYDGPSKTLTVGAAGVWSYYDHRMVLPVLAAGVNPATITTELTGSLGEAAKALVQLAHTHTGGALPIVLPPDEAGTAVQDYPGSAFVVTGQALRDLTQVDGGPEIQFVPRRTTADPRHLEWVMRVGTAAAPLLTQTGIDWVWDATAPQSSVSAISVTRDGSAMATQVYAPGAGTDTTTLVGQASDATLTAAGFPLLEAVTTAGNNANVQSKLAAAAAGFLAQSGRPVQTLSVTVRRDDDPTVGVYTVGDWVSITVVGDPYLPDGAYRTRITSISGDDSAQVNLALASTTGGP